MPKSKFSTNILTLLFGGSGFLLAGSIPIVSKIVSDIFPDIPMELLNTLLAVCSLFLLGCVGIVWVIRQEAPQIVMIKGEAARWLGWIVVVCFWGFAIYKFLLVFKIILSNL